ncbi:MAG: L-threonylcarbamoyladenylate synthase [Propioniciclava sp.]
MNHQLCTVNEDPEAAFDAAVTAVRAGETIVLPTDTVYGIGAAATDPAAVQRLLDAKERGRDVPPPVLVAEVPMVRALAEGVDDRVTALAEAFWPGALTLVLRAHASLRLDLGERGDTIAVRVPDHDFTRELLRRTGPLAVSSANIHGGAAALTVADAVSQLGDAVAVYLDAGEGSDPIPSTIVDLTGPLAHLLRAGRISVEELNQVIPGLIELPQPDIDTDNQNPASPPDPDAGGADGLDPQGAPPTAPEPSDATEGPSPASMPPDHDPRDPMPQEAAPVDADPGVSPEDTPGSAPRA